MFCSTKLNNKDKDKVKYTRKWIGQVLQKEDYSIIKTTYNNKRNGRENVWRKNMMQNHGIEKGDE